MVCPFNEDLIDLVQNNPALYNSSLPEFRNDEFKLHIWNEISKRLEEDVSICRRRWKSLRTRYTKELLKKERGVNRKKSRIYSRTWIYFEKMGFLYDYLRNKDHSNFYPEAMSSDEAEEDMALILPSKKMKANSGNPEFSADDANLEDLNPTISANQNDPEKENHENAVVAIQKIPKRVDTVSTKSTYGYGSHRSHKSPRNIFDRMQLEPKLPKEDDEFDIFGRLVAAKMRKLENPTELQVIILNIIKEHEQVSKEDFS